MYSFQANIRPIKSFFDLKKKLSVQGNKIK